MTPNTIRLSFPRSPGELGSTQTNKQRNAPVANAESANTGRNIKLMEYQYAELAEFLNDPKVTVRKEALMTILQFAQSKEARANFIGSDLVKYTIKLLGDEECQ